MRNYTAASTIIALTIASFSAPVYPVVSFDCEAKHNQYNLSFSWGATEENNFDSFIVFMKMKYGMPWGEDELEPSFSTGGEWDEPQFGSDSVEKTIYHSREIYPGYLTPWRIADGELDLLPNTINPDDQCHDFWYPATPLLLDLDRNNFHLGAGPVLFDINADGNFENLTWVSSSQMDAFIYLDRNGNGLVDDGSELFGSSTPLIGGTIAENGFEALAEFDLSENGGVEDGVIDNSDLIFAELRVWIDVNADGICTAQETMSLIQASVISLELHYIESPRTDPHGNHFEYISEGRMLVGGKEKRMWVTDVIFNHVNF